MGEADSCMISYRKARRGRAVEYRIQRNSNRLRAHSVGRPCEGDDGGEEGLGARGFSLEIASTSMRQSSPQLRTP